jgi:hypothetical protein
MSCGCRKNKSNDSRSTSSTPSLRYQVWRNGVFTGRSFTSLSQAQKFAAKVGGEVVAT